MGEVITIGLDLAKSVFQAHGADEAGAVVFRKKLRRGQILAFFAGQPRCLVAMEACAGAHYWAREIGALGHETRLIAPAYVKPFVKRQKNDAADAEAICEAAQSRACASFPSRTRSSRPMASCSGPGIFWCVSARNASMLCAGTFPNTATSFARASRMPQP